MGATFHGLEIDPSEFISAFERLNEYFGDCPEALRDEIQERFDKSMPMMSIIESPRKTGNRWKMKPSAVFIGLLDRARTYAGGWEGDEGQWGGEENV